MKLIDLLNGGDVPLIMYRTNSPFEDEEDMLYGYCKYENGELISLDGDNYYLNDEIFDWEYNGEILTVWIDVVWG